MPFKSKAQARAMHAKAGRGEISKKVIHEWDEATKSHGGFSKLPERLKKSAFEAGQQAAKQNFGLGAGTKPTPIAMPPQQPTIPSPGQSRSTAMDQITSGTIATPFSRLDQGTTFPVIR
jgi:hypothetical protein